MADYEDEMEPDWDAVLEVRTNAATLIDVVFWSADAVHTGYESCIDPKLVVVDITALDENSENFCRYVEQEYVEDGENEVTWHDWAVELKLEDTFVVGHWRVPVNGSPADWEWSTLESEKAFTAASLFVGKRVRRGMVVDQSAQGPRAPRTHH